MAAYEDMIQSWLSERAQARAMGAAPAPAPASAAPAAPAVAPTTVSARMGAQLPALGRFARGVGSLFGKTVPFAAPAIAGVSEVTGIAESAADPEQSKVQTAQRTAESISRLAGMGAGAGLGLVGGGPWGAVAGGALGYAIPQGAFALRDMVRNWNTPASTTPTAAASTTPTAAAALAPAPVASFASGAQGGFTPPTATPIRGYGANNQPYQPVTRTVGPDGTIRITGTGSPSTGGTGGYAGGYGAMGGWQPSPLPAINTAGEPSRDSASVGNIAGNFMGALVGMRQAAGTAKTQAAQTKLMMDYISKLPAAEKAGLESTMLRLRLSLDPDDPRSARRAALWGGHPEREGEKWGVPSTFIGEMKPGGAVPMESNRGAIEMRTVKPVAQTATKADFDADVKRLRSKAQVLQEYARRNITPPKE